MMIETEQTTPLILYPAPHRFTDYLRLCFVLPLDEPTATAASLLTSLLPHGTRRFPSNLALMRAFEENYGILVSLDTYRKGDLLIFMASLTAPDAARICDGSSLRRSFLRLFCEILLEPNTPGGRFPRDVFQLERRNHLRYLQSLPNHRHAYSRHRFEQHLFAGEPAATFPDGSPTICRDLSQAPVLSVLRSIQNDAPLLAFAFGHFSREELHQEIGALLRRRRKPSEKTFLREARDEPVTVVERLDGLEQAHIWLGLRAKVAFCSPHIAALALGVAIYGSGSVSRLFRRVREQMGLAYDVSATYIRTKGVVVANATVHPGRHKEVVEAMLQEFRDLARGNIKEEEFEMSRRMLLEELRGSCDSAGFLADFYTTTLLFGGEEEEVRRHGLEALVAEIERLKVEDVAAALSLFRPDTIYVLAPERKR